MNRLRYLWIAILFLLGCNSPFIRMEATPTAKVAPITFAPISSGSAAQTPTRQGLTPNLLNSATPAVSGECLGEVFDRTYIYSLQSARSGPPFTGFYYPGVTLADFAVEATIVVPNIPEYSYGLVFRELTGVSDANGNTPHYSLWITQNGKWGVQATGITDSQAVPFEAFYSSPWPGQKMTLRMVVVGGQGWVSIQGQAAKRFELSSHMDAGDIALTFGHSPHDGLTGAKFSGATLTIWNINRNVLGCTTVEGWQKFFTAPLPPQETLDRCLSSLLSVETVENTSTSDDPDYTMKHTTLKTAYPPRDFVVQARLAPPNVLRYQYGFSFRSLDNNANEWEEYRLWIHSDRTWHLERYPGREGEEAVQSGSLPPDIDPSQWNEVRLIVVGVQGWFFMNNTLISALDLSDINVAGSVALLVQAEGNLEISAPRDIGLWSVDTSASNCDSVDTWLAEFAD